MPMDVLMQPQDGVVFRNLSGCTTLGCCFDLAGFGDSPLSANRLRELVAPRLRIDPSLVQGLGCDPSQQRLVSAIISLADGLGLDTLATSVSAIADHAMLSQLGCCHVQGSAIAHPMVLQDTFAWLDRHREKLSRTPGLPRLAGG
jgi:EAL domain-containing protein (putative c-di-GMP-specific phosphodiesterase class I)